MTAFGFGQLLDLALQRFNLSEQCVDLPSALRPSPASLSGLRRPATGCFRLLFARLLLDDLVGRRPVLFSLGSLSRLSSRCVLDYARVGLSSLLLGPARAAWGSVAFVSFFGDLHLGSDGHCLALSARAGLLRELRRDAELVVPLGPERAADTLELALG